VSNDDPAAAAASAMAAAASLRLYGRPGVDRGAAVSPWPVQRRTALLAVLALRGDWVPRSDLAALLWPALPRRHALTNLRKAWHFAHDLVRESGLPVALEATAEALRFAPPCDVQRFQRAQRDGRWADALAAQQGVLLDGLNDPGNAAWTEWLEGERALQRRDWQAVARARLAQLAHDPPQAEALARTLLAEDALDEDAMVALLAAQRATHRHAEQRETYRAYAQRLDEELGVEPSTRVRAELQGAWPAATGLIGRGTELAALRGLLAEGGPRLVTIVGPGGIGKSALLKAFVRQCPEHRGTRWLPLDDLHAAAQAALRLCGELGAQPRPGESPQQAACRTLAGAALAPPLLALDNCEHLDGLAGLVEAWLHAAPRLRIVATSRERVGVPGERVLELRGLSLPAAQAGAADALASDAVQLFVAGARSVLPDFDAAREGAAMAALVRALGGLPLALLLAANWVRRLTVAEIGAELQQSLALLASAEEGDERPEHRSVEATFARSWQRLATHEQRVLAALSAFAGSFTLAAAADVARTSAPLLGSLADKSLVQFDAAARLSLHPLIRRYAAARLRDAPGAHERLALHYLRRLAQLAPRAAKGDVDAIDEIGRELENCRQAWAWGVAQRRFALLGDAVAALRYFFVARVQLVEGLALLQSARSADAPPDFVARLETAVGQLCYRCHRLPEADEAARRGLAAARAAGRRELIAQCLSVLGVGAYQRGQAPAARRLLEQALVHARAAGDLVTLSVVQANLALAERELGHVEQALAIMAELLPVQRAAGDWLRVTLGLANQGLMLMDLGRAAEAEAALSEGLRLCDEHRLEAARTGLMVNLAETLVQRGRLDEAEEICRRAMALLAEGQRPEIAAQVRNVYTHAALARGDMRAARRRVRDAAEAALQTQLVASLLEVVLCDSLVRVAERDFDTARRQLGWYLTQPRLERLDRQRATQALQRLPPAAPVARTEAPLELRPLVRAIADGR
jgi:predicted ATPase/DNA-binding SARP family transcriptional activator